MTEDIATADTTSPTEVETDGPSDEAPFGYMTDPTTGERRPKKRPGRRSKAAVPPAGKSPALEELQMLGSLSGDAEDTAPGTPPKGKRKPAMKAESLPPFRAGVIAKGMNRLYRRAGRLLRLFDQDIGSAVIACTMTDPDDDEDTTVGEAWENLAKTNPRIRAFLLRMMTGGAWTGLFMAHMPIFMAVAMKDGIRERIPLMGLANALLTDEPEPEHGNAGEPVPSGMAQMMGGIGPEDMAQMMAMAQGLMGQMANGVGRQPNMTREPTLSPESNHFMQREHPADLG